MPKAVNLTVSEASASVSTQTSTVTGPTMPAEPEVSIELTTIEPLVAHNAVHDPGLIITDHDNIPNAFQEGGFTASENADNAVHNPGPIVTDHDDNIPNAFQEGWLTASENADNDHGWTVVFACSLVAFWAVGTLYSWGVLQAALLKDGLSSTSTLSWIGSLAFTWIAVLGILNAKVLEALQPQKALFYGISTLGLSQIASSFLTHSVGGLFVTAGVLSGMGISICYLTVNVTPGQYFPDRRGLVNGIVCAGGGVGGTVICLAMNGLIQRVGPAWTLRILGLLTLGTGLPAAYLIKEQTRFQSNRFFQWRLFLDIKFITLFLVGIIATFPLLVPPFFIPLYSDSLNLSPTVGAGLVAGFNASSAFGRLLSGYACDYLGPLNVLFIVLSATALSMFIIWPFSTSVGPFVLFVLVSGFSNGGFFATVPTVIGTLFGLQMMPVVYGTVVTGWAPGYLFSAPIASYLLDLHGGLQGNLSRYYPAMFLNGGMALVAAILAGGIRLYINNNLRRRL